MSDYLTITQAARLLNVSEKTIQRALRSGELKTVHEYKNRARITLEELQAWRTVPARNTEEALLRRIEALEYRVEQMERQLDKQRQRVKPVSLFEFAALHNVGSLEYQRAINMNVLPVRFGELDGPGQQAFWQIFHELPSYVPCEGCPH